MQTPTDANPQDDFLAAMTAFARGHWTRERPTKPGFYPVCGVGSSPGNERVLAYTDPRTGSVSLVTPWGGWFWSEPFPKLPNPPDSKIEG